MSNRPKKFNNPTSTHHHATAMTKKSVTKKTILKWGAIILGALLLFWLFLAENFDAFSGWANP